MPEVIGEPRNYDQKWNFRVEIAGLTIAHFDSVKGLEFEAGVIEQNEGGTARVADKSPGKIKYSPVVLTTGATSNRELFDWWELVYNAASNKGAVGNSYKKNVTILQLDRDQTVKKRWTLSNAWPSKFVAGEWDAKADENTMQEMTLQYDAPGLIQ